jgi:hypothetical protein
MMQWLCGIPPLSPPEHRRGINRRFEDSFVQGFITIERDKFESGCAKLEQLEALVASISGPGLENFKELTGRLQEHLMWLALDLAREAKEQLVVAR